MTKLMELLKEFEETKNKSEQLNWTRLWVRASQYYVISKPYWFIKWLVDQDKLLWNNKLQIRELTLWMPEKQDYYIMMLAVSPNPIDFLISILK